MGLGSKMKNHMRANSRDQGCGLLAIGNIESMPVNDLLALLRVNIGHCAQAGGMKVRGIPFAQCGQQMSSHKTVGARNQ